MQEVVRESEMPDNTIVMLAATSLADAVVLDSGPILLPPAAPAPEPPETDKDAAEAVGSTYNNALAGTLGEVGIFSFNNNKIVTTYGGGSFSHREC